MTYLMKAQHNSRHFCTGSDEQFQVRSPDNENVGVQRKRKASAEMLHEHLKHTPGLPG